MNKDEIKREIDCKSACQTALLGFARDYEHEIAALEADLAEAEKPELRHLDFGANTDQRWIKLGETIHWVHEGRMNDTSVLADKEFAKERKGNLQDIFDDLKARQEPLKKFTMKETTAAAEFSGSINKWTVYLKDHCHGPGVNIGIKDIPDFILNLERLVYTAGQEGHHE
ncbi:hypothetical protein LCGC14_1764830 [marine sediment metagenome]|uniref:Uncharacterized protein n=1 Tax=marine sediment metagenome TaxID=412755 RepID=A0A0F9HMG9_9ZZZZ